MDRGPVLTGAIEELEALGRSRPGCPAPWIEMAVALRSLGQGPSAVDALDAAAASVDGGDDAPDWMEVWPEVAVARALGAFPGVPANLVKTGTW